MRSLRLVPALLILLIAQSAAARAYSAGDHVRVLVVNQSYPAVVTSVHRDVVYTIRYDAGYGDYATLLEYIQPATGGRWSASYRPANGTAVRVKLGGADYAAHVIATREDDVYRVRYADGSEWDTLAEYMRPSGFYHAWSAGDRVQVLWKGVWYDARILTPLGSDHYRVHYDGESDAFDEDVAGERVRTREGTGATVAVSPHVSITIGKAAHASGPAPVEYTFLGMDAKASAIRYRIKVSSAKPIEEVHIATKYIAANGKVVNDTTVVWQNIVKSKRQPIENGRTYEDTSYLYPNTARVESRLAGVVFTDGSRWEAPR